MKSELNSMTKDEQEKFAELIAIKVSEKYLVVMKEHVSTQIKLHAFQCAAGKFAWVKSLVSAITGGTIVGLIMWAVDKF